MGGGEIIFDFTQLTTEQRAKLAVVISQNVAERMLESLDAKSAADRKIIKYASAVSATAIACFIQACQELQDGRLELIDE